MFGRAFGWRLALKPPYWLVATTGTIHRSGKQGLLWAYKEQLPPTYDAHANSLRMDPLLIYLYTAAILAVFLSLQKYINLCLRFIFNPRLATFITRHLVLPYLLPRWYLWGPVTRLQALLHCIHLAGTLTCNIFRVSSLSMARSRAGSLAVFHLMPLALAPRLSMGAKLFGLPLEAYHYLHYSIGLMATFQSILHVILAVRTIPFDLSNRHQRNGLIVSEHFLSGSWLNFPQGNNFSVDTDVDGFACHATPAV